MTVKNKRKQYMNYVIEGHQQLCNNHIEVKNVQNEYNIYIDSTISSVKYTINLGFFDWKII